MKRSLCVIAAAAVLLTGCGSKTPVQEESISYGLSFGDMQSPAEAPDYDTITDHEGSWSREELLSVCYIFGTRLAPQMSLQYLGGNYIADTELSEVNPQNEADCILNFRCTAGNVTDIIPVGTITMGGIASTAEITGSTPVHEITVNTAELPGGYVSGISLNGADMGDEQGECIKALGSPQLALDREGNATFTSAASLMVYTDKDGNELLMLSFADNKLTDVMIFFEGHMNMLSA